jgi:hypothetical protein
MILQSVLPVYFCNKFCLIFAANICVYSQYLQGGSDKSGIFFFLLSNDTAQLKIIRFD